MTCGPGVGQLVNTAISQRVNQAIFIGQLQGNIAIPAKNKTPKKYTTLKKFEDKLKGSLHTDAQPFSTLYSLKLFVGYPSVQSRILKSFFIGAFKV